MYPFSYLFKILFPTIKKPTVITSPSIVPKILIRVKAPSLKIKAKLPSTVIEKDALLKS